MNLRQLYYFRTLAQIKHFTKASVQLMVTQPSLSNSMNDLEEELGICLFNRTNRQVSLTKYGELFLEYVNRSLSALDEGVLKLNNFISPEQGTVALHYVSSLDPFVPYLVARFYEENAGLQTTFQFEQTTNINIQNSLAAGTADLGLGMNYDLESGLKYHKLGEHKLVLLVSTNHPLARQDSVDLQDVRGAKFITYNYDCVIRSLIDNIFSSLALDPHIVCETIHDTMIYGAVAANLGIALAPMPLRRNLYNVKALTITNPIPNHEVYLRWKDIRYTSPAVSFFRDFIMEHPNIFDEFRASL